MTPDKRATLLKALFLIVATILLATGLITHGDWLMAVVGMK